MSIKKAYTEIHKVLETAQKAGKVDKQVFAKCVDLMSAKRAGGTGGSSAIRNDKGEVVAINCYYFKRWMPVVGPKAVEFGKKAGSGTGFSSMCKEGTKLWTKQLNDSKKAKEQILVDVQEGTIKPADIQVEMDKIEKARASIAKTDLGFAKQADVEAYLKTVK